LFKTAYDHIFLVENLNFGKEKGNASLDSDDRISSRRLDLNVKRGHWLVFRKTEHLGEKTEFFLATVKNGFAGFRIQNVKIIGRLENPCVFLYEKGIFTQD